MPKSTKPRQRASASNTSHATKSRQHTLSSAKSRQRSSATSNSHLTKSRPTHISHASRASFWQVGQLVLLMTLPVILFFAYYPIIPLGNSSSMNFEFSLPLIWLILFNACSLISFLKYRFAKKLNFSTRTTKTNSQSPTTAANHFSPTKKIALLAFPLYFTLSCLWSANPLRGFLTVGILWLILGAIVGSIFLLYHILRNKSIVFPQRLTTSACHPFRIFCKILLISALVISGICWLQCILDLAGINRNVTLLCEGCTYLAFGFPHPSGFAIEPQFMGGLLIAPTLLALYLWQTRRSLLFFLAAFFLSATLFLTFSRGAIYAFAVAILFILISLTVYSKKHQSTKANSISLSSSKDSSDGKISPSTSKTQHHPRLSLVAIPVIAFVFTLLAQGIFAALSPTSDTFITGVTKSIHHLSLGLIDLRPTIVREIPSGVDNYALAPKLSNSLLNTTASIASPPSSVAPPASIAPPSNSVTLSPSTTSSSTLISLTEASSTEDAMFNGYVAVSTDIRVRLTRYALETWRSNPVYTFFGTGLGSAGTVLYQHYPELGSPKEIVQNEYASLLLETGVMGYFMLAISGITLIQILRQKRLGTSLSLPHIYWFALVLAYAITICFFSGLPNALHIYLLIPLILSFIYYTNHQKVLQ